MDDRVRGLERAAAGDVESAARLLWERVRRGELDLERLRLAAYVGERRARLALGAQAPDTPGELRKLVGGLEPWGKEALVRAALAAALRCVHLLEGPAPLLLFDDRGPTGGEWSRAAVEAAGAWLREPCEARANDATAVVRRSVVQRTSRGEGDAAEALQSTLELIGARPRTGPAKKAADCAVRALERQGRVEFPADEVLAAIRRALVAWTLGADDPLARCGPPADPALWTPRPGEELVVSEDARPIPWPFPRDLERSRQGLFFIDRRDGQRWLGLERPDGSRWFLTPFPPRDATPSMFHVNDDLLVVAWAERLDLVDALEVRRDVRGRGPAGSSREGVIVSHRVDCVGALEDLAVSPSGERVVWVTSHEGAPDAVWHLDLRQAQPEPRRVTTEHAVARGLHFPTHCAVGFVTDRAAWDACPPEERKGALLHRLPIRMELL